MNFLKCEVLDSENMYFYTRLHSKTNSSPNNTLICLSGKKGRKFRFFYTLIYISYLNDGSRCNCFFSLAIVLLFFKLTNVNIKK